MFQQGVSAIFRQNIMCANYNYFEKKQIDISMTLTSTGFLLSSLGAGLVADDRRRDALARLRCRGRGRRRSLPNPHTLDGLLLFGQNFNFVPSSFENVVHMSCQ